MSDEIQLLLYVAIGLVLGAAGLGVPMVLAPRSKGEQAEKTYECGVDTVGSAWIRFGVSFYLFALIFVAFEVDVLYLFPVALAFGDPELGWRAFAEVGIFLFILSLAILFAWRKGVFSWAR